MPTTTPSAGRTNLPAPQGRARLTPLPVNGEERGVGSGAYAPSVLVTPDAAAIDDGGGYGDPLPEGRPDFVREDDRRKS